MKFKYGSGNWVEYRKLLPDLVERDFHWSEEKTTGLYHENMQAVWDVALDALITAQATSKQYVMFTHGGSTSRLGKTTSRSQVRKLMRSKEATPYIIRRECIEQSTIFIAAIRPLKSGGRYSNAIQAQYQEPSDTLALTEQTKPHLLPQSTAEAEQQNNKTRLYECHSCGIAVGNHIAKLCFFNTARFGGSIYCLDCQQKIQSSITVNLRKPWI